MRFTVNFLSNLLFSLVLLGMQEVSFAQDPNFHIYLSFGQSNMAGAGDIETQDLMVDSRFQFMKPQDCPAKNQYAGNFYKAVPPLWGCTGGIGPSDYFGRTMVANLPSNIKVAVSVVAIPGCKIELFGKTGYQGLDTYNNVPSKYNGSAYAWMLDLAKQAQKVGVIKGFLLHQGESNSGDQAWPTKVKGIYDNLIADLGLDPTKTPLLAGELLYADQGSCCSGHNTIIAKLPSVLPNSYVISAKGLPGKDVYHFNSAGNRTFGERYAQKMLSLQPAGPSVSFSFPANNAIITQSTSITLSATATSPSGTITNVKFYDGTTLLTTDALAPYSFVWTPISAGTHTLKALVTNSAGITAESLITVTVNVPQGPFKTSAFTIPGIIQAEDYDLGGEGVAFHEANTNGNQGLATYRTDEVDIETCADAGSGYNVAYILNGEWLEYSINVTETTKYDFEFRLAKDGTNGLFHVEIDGINVTGPISVANTAGWQVWQSTVFKEINLTTGMHIMRIAFDSDYMNLNYVNVKKSIITGVDNDQVSNIHMYPNPFAAEGLRIEGKGNFAYKILDVNGNILEIGSIENTAFIGQKLGSGVYFMNIQFQKSNENYKIIKL